MRFSARVRRAAIVLVVATIALSSVVGPVSAGLLSSGADSGATNVSAVDLGGSLGPGDINASSDEVTAGSGNVSVWQRAPLALDTNEYVYSDESSVDTYLDTPSITVSRGGDEIEYGKQQISFFKQGKTITAKLDEAKAGGGGSLDGQRVQYVAVRLGENGVPEVDSLEDLPSLLANDPDVTGRIVGEEGSYSGSSTVTFTPRQSGQYALIAVAVDDDDGAGVSGPEESVGQLSVDSPVTIVGVDLFPVRKANDGTTVHAYGRPAGENVSVKANTSADFAAKTVRHTVLVIDEENVSDQSVELVIGNDSVSKISTSIGSTDGVARIEPDPSTVDVPLADLGTNTTESLVAALRNESENVTVTTGDAVINASVTSVEAGPATTVDVGTKSGWPSGNFTYLYVATPANGTETVARRGKVSVQDETEAYVTGFELSKDSAERGEEVIVNATIFNPDDREGETVELEVDGTVVDTKKIEDIPSNEVAYAEFTLSRDEVGYYEVAVDNLPSKTLKIDEEARVTGFGLSSDRVGIDDEVTVTATVFNPGLAEDETVEFKIDGAVVETKRIDRIPGGEETTVEFTTSFSEEGTYELGIDKLDTETLKVDDEAFVERFRLSSSTIQTDQTLNVTATVRNPGDLKEDETVELRVDGTVRETKTVSVGGDSTQAVTFALEFGNTGERAVSVDTLKSKTVTVRSRPGDDPGDAPGGPGGAPGGDPGGAPGGGQGGDSDNDGPDSDVIETGSGATIIIDQARIGQRVNVDVGASATSEGIGLTGLSIGLGQSTDGFRVEVTSAQSNAPDGVPEVEQARDDARAIGYFTATPRGNSVPQFDGVTYNFSVPDSTLPEGASDERVVLLRYDEDEGAWNRLPTSARGNGTYRAESPGFSVYAIGIRQERTEARFTVSETSIDATELGIGEETTVSATVRNDGNASGTFTANLTIDGEVVDTREVTVASGESETVEFVVSFEKAGSYRIGVSDRTVSTVTVQDEQATTTEPATTTPDEGSNVPLWFPLGLLSAFILIGAYVVYITQQDHREDPL